MSEIMRWENGRCRISCVPLFGRAAGPYAYGNGQCAPRRVATHPHRRNRRWGRDGLDTGSTSVADFYHTKNLLGTTAAAQMEDGTGIVFAAPEVPQPGPEPPNVLYALTSFGFLVQGIPRQE